MSKGWDSNMLKKLKTLVGKGLSASEIGKKLEVSKNAVIGKLNRLGWNAKAVETTDKKTTKSKKDTKETKNVSKKTAKKSVLKTLFNKKAEKKVVNKKETVKQSANKAVKKNADTKKTDKKAAAEKPTIKTASKKTQKDLALHELLIQHALQMASLKPNQCRWPIGDPDSDNFHFCGETVFAGKPYCYEHCRQAYQFTTPPKKK